MKVPAFNLKNPDAQLVLAVAVLVVVVYFVGKKTITAAANAAGGIISGNNAITAGTEYQGTGVLGTLGAATNDASGGFFNWLGDKIGGGAFALFGPSSTPAPATTVNNSSSTLQDPNGGATGSW